MKRKYVSPAVQAYDVCASAMICNSTLTGGGNGGGLGAETKRESLWDEEDDGFWLDERRKSMSTPL